MKITKQGFEITEIGSVVHSLISDGERVRFTFLSNSAGDKAHSPMFDASEVDATIEALQAARRMLADEPAEKRLVGLKDGSGDVWKLRDGRFYLTDSSTPWTRADVDSSYGPVTEIWE